MLADENAFGMPIHSGLCTVISSGHDSLCMRFLERWREKFPKYKLKGDMTPEEVDAACIKEFGRTYSKAH
jgi:hypothetical protein